MYIFILYYVLQTRPYAYRSRNCSSLMYRSMRGFSDVSNRFRRGFDDSSRCSCLIGVVVVQISVHCRTHQRVFDEVCASAVLARLQRKKCGVS
ncbi:hypothetical protein V8C44DRAFT_318500 [Trichoderma aethiopicum]